ncbi:hypothetical protein [Jiangella mangrovi]|uniref:Uncharacterized protein n=1 Tax=Jiangella mangrovi TaxID=1524084 RepID=A0A7W9LNX2_9ACTN|nr:hypothetical protein [Jiangella mangrovi]MBB5790750.1 hypothetical protein [Jiangella mangrovi]
MSKRRQAGRRAAGRPDPGEGGDDLPEAAADPLLPADDRAGGRAPGGPAAERAAAGARAAQRLAAGRRAARGPAPVQPSPVQPSPARPAPGPPAPSQPAPSQPAPGQTLSQPAPGQTLSQPAPAVDPSAERAAAGARAAQRLAAGRRAARRGLPEPASNEPSTRDREATATWSAFPDSPPRPRRAARQPTLPLSAPDHTGPPARPQVTPSGPVPRRSGPIEIPSIGELALYGTLATAVAVAVLIVNDRPYWQAAAVVAGAALLIVLLAVVAARSRPDRPADDPTRPRPEDRRRRRT